VKSSSTTKTLRPRARASSPWHSTLVQRHESNTRASGLRHDVFNRIRHLKLDYQAISPDSSALRSRNAPNPRKGVSRALSSNGDPNTQHCTGISRLVLKPRMMTPIASAISNSITSPSALAAAPFALGMPRTPERAYLALARAMVIQILDTVLASSVSH